MKNKVICLFVAFIFLFSVSVHAASSWGDDNSEKELITQTISQYFDIYMNAMVIKNHPDFSKVVIKNENTVLYGEMVNYEVDNAILFEAGFTDYSYSLKYDKFSITGNKAEVGLILNSAIQFERVPADLTTNRCIAYSFILTKVNDTWMITEINSDYIVFVEFIKALKQTYPSVKQYSSVQIGNEVNDRIGSLKTSSEIAKSGRMSDEVQRKLTDIQALDKLTKSTNTVIPTSIPVSYTKSAAIDYANFYALEGKNSTKRLFYYSGNDQDCTNYLSQCVWAGYGGYDASNLAQTKTNITNKYRMVNATGNDWYTKGWFGHNSGGTGPWEQVVTHWNYMLDSNKTKGPSGNGYNDGKLYSDFSASAIFTAEALQFYNKSKQSNYHHSVFTVQKEGNTYADIYCNAHSGEYKNEPLTTFIAAFGGANNCYMRNLMYTSGAFDS